MQKCVDCVNRTPTSSSITVLFLLLKFVDFIGRASRSHRRGFVFRYFRGNVQRSSTFCNPLIKEHRLSVHDQVVNYQNSIRHHHHRASGSRTDMSTDDETRSSQQDGAYPSSKRNGSVGSSTRSTSTKKRLSRQDSTARRRRLSEERDSRRRVEKSVSSCLSSNRSHHDQNKVRVVR